MKIQPLGNNIQLKLDEPKAGVLDTSSRSVVIEKAEVVAVGPDVKINVKVGDKVLFKSWALDSVVDNDKKYYFISTDTNGLLAIVK